MKEELKGVEALEVLLFPGEGRAVYFPRPEKEGTYSVGGEEVKFDGSGFSREPHIHSFGGNIDKYSFQDVLGAVLNGVEMSSRMPNKGDLLAVVDFRDRKLSMSNKELKERLKKEGLVGVVFASRAASYPRDRVAFVMFVKKKSLKDFMSLVRENPQLLREMTHKWAPEFDDGDRELRRVKDSGKLVVMSKLGRRVEQEELTYKGDVKEGWRELLELVPRDYDDPELSVVGRLLESRGWRGELEQLVGMFRDGLEGIERDGGWFGRREKARIVGRDEFVELVQRELGERFGLREEEPLMPADFAELVARLQVGDEPEKVAKWWLARMIKASAVDFAESNLTKDLMDGIAGTLLVVSNGGMIIEGGGEFVTALGRETSRLVNGERIGDGVVSRLEVSRFQSEVWKRWGDVMTWRGWNERKVGVNNFLRVVGMLSDYLVDEGVADKGREFQVTSEDEAKFVQELVGDVLEHMPRLREVLGRYEPKDLLVDDSRLDNQGFGPDYEHPIGVYRDLVLWGRILYHMRRVDRRYEENFYILEQNRDYNLLESLGVSFIRELDAVSGEWELDEYVNPKDRDFKDKVLRLLEGWKALKIIGDQSVLDANLVDFDEVRRVFGKYMGVPEDLYFGRRRVKFPEGFVEEVVGRAEVNHSDASRVNKYRRLILEAQKQEVGIIIRERVVKSLGFGGILALMMKLGR